MGICLAVRMLPVLNENQGGRVENFWRVKGVEAEGFLVYILSTLLEGMPVFLSGFFIYSFICWIVKVFIIKVGYPYFGGSMIRRKLRVLSAVVAASFLVQDLSFAAIQMKPSELALFPKSIPSIELPRSVATVGESYQADGRISGKDKTFILIQDAHTNESAQMNIARSLKTIIEKEKIRFVFLEAADGNNSLALVRDKAPEKKRQQVAREYLRKGVLDGSEYLDITADPSLDFIPWGVENKELYWQSLKAYEKVAKGREKFHAYLNEVARAIETLKPRIFGASLQEFDQKRQQFLKEKMPLTDYIEVLMQQMKFRNIAVTHYPHLLALSKLKDKEKSIDFNKANEEQADAMNTLSAEDQEILQEAAMGGKDAPFKLSMQDHKTQKAFYALLEEKMVTRSPGHQVTSYPELLKYFEYLKEAEKISPKDILTEQKLLEEEIYALLAKTEDERALHQADEAQRFLVKLFSLTVTPDEFRAYKKDKESYSVTSITGFLNRKIMDLRDFYERVTFLKDDYEDYVKSAEEFYRLTYERDMAFLDNSIAMMDKVGDTKAILVTGGYHTPNLMNLLKDKSLSYIVVTPQVFHETNLKKYESLLLNQTEKNVDISPKKFKTIDNRPQTTAKKTSVKADKIAIFRNVYSQLQSLALFGLTIQDLKKYRDQVAESFSLPSALVTPDGFIIQSAAPADTPENLRPNFTGMVQRVRKAFSSKQANDGARLSSNPFRAEQGLTNSETLVGLNGKAAVPDVPSGWSIWSLPYLSQKRFGVLQDLRFVDSELTQNRSYSWIPEKQRQELANQITDIAIAIGSIVESGNYETYVKQLDEIGVVFAGLGLRDFARRIALASDLINGARLADSAAAARGGDRFRQGERRKAVFNAPKVITDDNGQLMLALGTGRYAVDEITDSVLNEYLRERGISAIRFESPSNPKVIYAVPSTQNPQLFQGGHNNWDLADLDSLQFTLRSLARYIDKAVTPPGKRRVSNGRLIQGNFGARLAFQSPRAQDTSAPVVSQDFVVENREADRATFRYIGEDAIDVSDPNLNRALLQILELPADTWVSITRVIVEGAESGVGYARAIMPGQSFMVSLVSASQTLSLDQAAERLYRFANERALSAPSLQVTIAGEQVSIRHFNGAATTGFIKQQLSDRLGKNVTNIIWSQEEDRVTISASGARLADLNETQLASLDKAAATFNLSPASRGYLREMLRQHHYPDASPKRIVVNRDDSNDPGNFILASTLTEDEVQSVMKAFEFATLDQDASNRQAANRVVLTANTLDGGIGENMGRLQELIERAKKAGLPTDTVRMGAKGTDLGFDLEINGVPVYVSIAEIKLNQLILLARDKKFAGMKFQPIVNWQSKKSYEALLDSIYLFDRTNSSIPQAQKRTYRQVFADAGIEILPMFEQEDLPAIHKATGLITSNTDAPRQPGGHGQLGFVFFHDIFSSASPSDGRTHIRVFYNGDNPNSRPNPAIAGAMAKNGWPLVKIVTPATPIDKKGGKDGVRKVVVGENGQLVLVPDQMELADAKAVGQTEVFQDAGQQGGLGRTGKQPFNTNIIYFNETVLREILKELAAVIGERELEKVFSPTLIRKDAKKGKDGEDYIPVDSAIGVAIHNLNAFFMTSQNPQVQAILTKRGLDRLLYFVNIPRILGFTPNKNNFDLLLQREGGYYRFNVDQMALEEIEPGNPLPEVEFISLGADGKDDKFWNEQQNYTDAFKGSDFSRLNSLSVRGKIVASNTDFVGNVAIEIETGGVFDLEALRVLGQDRLRLENVKIRVSKNGEISINGARLAKRGAAARADQQYYSGRAADEKIYQAFVDAAGRFAELASRGQVGEFDELELLRDKTIPATFKALSSVKPITQILEQSAAPTSASDRVREESAGARLADTQDTSAPVTRTPEPITFQSVNGLDISFDPKTRILSINEEFSEIGSILSGVLPGSVDENVLIEMIIKDIEAKDLRVDDDAKRALVQRAVNDALNRVLRADGARLALADAIASDLIIAMRVLEDRSDEEVELAQQRIMDQLRPLDTISVNEIRLVMSGRQISATALGGAPVAEQALALYDQLASRAQGARLAGENQSGVRRREFGATPENSELRTPNSEPGDVVTDGARLAETRGTKSPATTTPVGVVSRNKLVSKDRTFRRVEGSRLVGLEETPDVVADLDKDGGLSVFVERVGDTRGARFALILDAVRLFTISVAAVGLMLNPIGAKDAQAAYTVPFKASSKIEVSSVTKTVASDPNISIADIVTGARLSVMKVEALDLPSATVPTLLEWPLDSVAKLSQDPEIFNGHLLSIVEGGRLAQRRNPNIRFGFSSNGVPENLMELGARLAQKEGALIDAADQFEGIVVQVTDIDNPRGSRLDNAIAMPVDMQGAPDALMDTLAFSLLMDGLAGSVRSALDREDNAFNVQAIKDLVFPPNLVSYLRSRSADPSLSFTGSDVSKAIFDLDRVAMRKVAFKLPGTEKLGTYFARALKAVRAFASAA